MQNKNKKKQKKKNSTVQIILWLIIFSECDWLFLFWKNKLISKIRKNRIQYFLLLNFYIGNIVKLAGYNRKTQ